MQFSDFEPEHADDKPVPGRWRARDPLVTPSGEFSVVLRAGANGATPDEAMLAEMSALVDYVARHHAEVLGLLHDDYALAAEDSGYLESVGVPRGLSRAELGAYLGPLTLFVRRSRGRPVGGLTASPRWAEEHGLDLVFAGGRLERLEY